MKHHTHTVGGTLILAVIIVLLGAGCAPAAVPIAAGTSAPQPTAAQPTSVVAATEAPVGTSAAQPTAPPPTSITAVTEQPTAEVVETVVVQATAVPAATQAPAATEAPTLSPKASKDAPTVSCQSEGGDEQSCPQAEPCPVGGGLVGVCFVYQDGNDKTTFVVPPQIKHKGLLFSFLQKNVDVPTPEDKTNILGVSFNLQVKDGSTKENLDYFDPALIIVVPYSDQDMATARCFDQTGSPDCKAEKWKDTLAFCNANVVECSDLIGLYYFDNPLFFDIPILARDYEKRTLTGAISKLSKNDPPGGKKQKIPR